MSGKVEQTPKINKTVQKPLFQGCGGERRYEVDKSEPLKGTSRTLLNARAKLKIPSQFGVEMCAGQPLFKVKNGGNFRYFPS